ncbi:MAG: class I tRNA ligase family protein [Candidatus Yanofskybacteria bacterium]|nr:class I tRNA ligase family protein [Candidatus Yanofskybacteria bacterium]
MSDNFDFKKIEEEVMDFWEKNKVFEQSLERRKKSKSFIFFEGPPTANAKPAIHHLIGRVFKDVFCRYKTMRGFYVERKSGWDTHGLPVEIEVEKSLSLKSKKEIEEYGIAKFNRQAKESVWKYKEEWERFTKRIGFWLDLKNPYITYDPKYIETLWWILKKVWDKKMLFKGHKVVPFCTRCGTPLSSHEVAQGYRTITDKSVIVKFKIKPACRTGRSSKLKISEPITYNLEPRTYLLAWTTTPWTLAGNVALAVNKSISYSAVLIDGVDELLIVATDLVEKVFAGHAVKTLSIFKGDRLLGLEYESLFDIPKLKSEKSYKIYPADFVTTTDGTGIVHTAVMYGEDDYKLGKEVGLPTNHTVDEQGKFVGVSKELDGKYVKDKTTEDLILKELEAKNLVFKTENFEHDYPFCWRCGTPLLYYATDSWFIGMSKLEKKLTSNNKKVNWHPGHLKEGRFGEWLRGVKDWAISRERYWGTPLPIWFCYDQNQIGKVQSSKFKVKSQGGCGNILVVGSFEDLEKHRWRKKNNYFLMRHGFSTKNADKIINTRLENDKYPLTDEGRKDTEREAKKLKKAKIDFIYSSYFLRAKETAEIINKATDAKIYFDERLKEINHGTVCEGKSESFCLAQRPRPVTGFDYKFGDGESWNEVRRRMLDFIAEVDKKHEGKNILIVSHGDPLAMLNGSLFGWSDEKLLKVVNGEQRDLYPKKGKFYKAEFKNLPWDENGYINPHRPYIDEIFLSCPKCKSKMQRVKEVADVWFDSGAMPYAQWHYPFENKSVFKKNFPADFIAEGIDQTRGWFYTLLAVSTLLDKGPAYKNVLSYSHVLDEKGQKMSKSKGNVVDPWMVMDKFGVDAVRWYFYSVNNPGESNLFSLDEVALRLRGFVMTLWNSFRFFELYNLDNKDFPVNFHKNQPKSLLDQWILSRLNQTVETATLAMESYDPTTATRSIESFVVEDFSKWWLRRSRSKFQKPESEESLKESLSLLRFLLLEMSKLIAPFTPFVAEYLHKELHRGSKAGTDSVHLHDWPKSNKKLINPDLEKEMDKVRQAVTAGLALRKEAKIKVRQPLQQLSSSVVAGLKLEYINLIKDEVNVKEVVTGPDKLDLNLDDALIYEGWARELIRQIQDMRKEAGYAFNDKVLARWHTEDRELKSAVERWGDFIKNNALLKGFSPGQHDESKHFDIQKEFELAPQKKIWLGVRR